MLSAVVIFVAFGLIASAVFSGLASAGAGTNAGWLCESVAEMMANSHLAISAETPAQGDDAAVFASNKSRGLVDLDKGIGWAQRGCRADEDCGTLVPSIFKDAQARLESGQGVVR